MRKLLTLILSLLLVVGSLTATFGTAHIRDFELRGYVDPTKDQNLPFTRPRPGVNVELLQYEPVRLATTLEAIRAANFKWIRQFAYWDEIELERGQFDWRAWDRLTAALEAFPELELVVVLMNSPPWAQAEQDRAKASRTAPPRSLGDFANFSGGFAARYGDLVDYYQIWDEPNLGDAWGGAEPRAAEYVALLAAARSAILRADPAASIAAAALAPTVETGGANLSDIRYLKRMYEHGARDLMDIVAGKPYGQSSSPLDREIDEGRLNFSRIIALREVMVANEDGKKPLWASSYGWNALPEDWSGEASIWGAATPAEQVQYTLQALDRAHREWPWLGAMFLHHWQPAAGAESAQWGFALVGRDGAASPLLQALGAYQYPSLAQDGLYHAANAHARYSGVWSFSDLGADIGWLPTTDSQLAFDFFGRDLAMLLREDDYFAFLYPTVDGQSPNAAQHDAKGDAYILLRSNSRRAELNLAPIARDLALGSHTLRASADQGWDRWAIAGYAVSSGDLSAPYNRQIALGALASCLSLAALALSIAAAPWNDWLPRLAKARSSLGALASLALAGVTSFFMMLAMLWTWDSPRASLLARDEINIVLALLTGGALYLSPTFLVSLVLGLLLFVQIYHRITNGLILTLFFAPFFLFPVELHVYALSMVELTLLITAAAGLVKLMALLGERLRMANGARPALPREILQQLTPIDLAIACIALLGVVSLLWTAHLEVALRELRTLIIEPCLFYLLLRFARPNRQALAWLYGALLAAGLLVSLIGFFDLAIGAGASPLKSVYGSPNNVGLLLGRTLPLALALALGNISPRLRWLAVGAFLIMLTALLMTQSLGAIALGAPIGLATVVIGRYGRRAILPLLALAAAAVLTLGAASRISPALADLIDFSSGTNFVRLRLWESGAAMIRDRPIRGIGLDQFLYYYGGEYVKPDAIWDADLSHPHNFVLDFWTRLSLAGLIAFACIQLSFWRRAFEAARALRGRDPLTLALALGLAGGMAATLAHGLVDNSVFVIDLAYIFMFQLAALLRIQDWGRRPGAFARPGEG